MEATLIEKIIEMFPDEEFLIADELDEAVIGVDEMSMRIIYSYRICLEILEDKYGMSEEEAVDYFSYNISGGYVGEKTPIWCYDYF